jgi:hypothetical protein
VWSADALRLARLDFAARTSRTKAALHGVVRDTAGRGLVGVTVTVDTVRRAVTSGDGTFAIDTLPPGEHLVTFRAVGFAPREVELTSGSTTSHALDVDMVSAQLLSSVAVRADRIDNRSMMVRALEERRRSGLAVFRDSLTISRLPTLSAALAAIPNVRVVGSGTSGVRVYMSLAPGLSRSTRECEARLLLDDVPSDWIQLTQFQPSDLAWIEVYPRATRLPAEFQVTTKDAACGLVVVYTKRRIAR